LIREIEAPDGACVALCPDGNAPSKLCAYSVNGPALLEKASDWFVATMARPGPALDAEIAVWLAESPCHHCAWRRISSVWQALPQAGHDLA
jgi:hypothetical protein